MTDSKESSFSFSDLDSRTLANEGVDVEIINPATGVSTGFVIHVLGMDSKVYKDLEAKQRRARLARVAKMGKIPPRTDDEMRESALDLMVACTVRWGMKDGSPFDVECTPENVRDTYERYDEIKEQVEAAIIDRTRFIRA